MGKFDSELMEYGKASGAFEYAAKRFYSKFCKPTVCVAPAGDDMNAMSGNIRYFDSKNCDVAITACRSKGITVKLLLDLASNIGSEIEWVQKSYEHSFPKSTQGLCNQETSQLIFDMI